MRCALICLWLVLGVGVHSAGAQSAEPEGPEANPGRPTVSTPATLTPTGYLQFETGTLAANHSPEFSSRLGLNEVIKLSVIPVWNYWLRPNLSRILRRTSLPLATF